MHLLDGDPELVLRQHPIAVGVDGIEDFHRIDVSGLRTGRGGGIDLDGGEAASSGLLAAGAGGGHEGAVQRGG